MSAGDTVVSDIGQQERVVSGESRPARSLHCGCLWAGPPHRISRRLSARLLRLPLKGGVMGAALWDCRVPLASSDFRGQDAHAPGSMTALSDHTLPQHAGETPAFPGGDQGHYAVVDNTNGDIWWPG